ncbi:imelysin family protein [Psychromonas hadalis]|uniref:imelysin family protein n=1 Tax=Psychromonas hadalis TaxID=211669 RepID=UPI0003B4EAA4|nr:imelysin family protein [Psychromonas hadalis]
MKKILLLSCLIATPVISADFNIVEQINTLKIEQSQFFNQKSQTLATSIHAFCRTADFSAEQQNIQQSWLQTMQAWMPLQGVTKGPINDLDLAWSIQFWPDKKDITGRKIKLLLQSGQTDWNAQQVSEQSVAVRGLGALELLIFEQQLNAQNCPLASAIATHLDANSQRISTAWSEQYGPQLLLQSQDKKQQKVIEQRLIAELSHQLSFINKKFLMPLGKTHPRPYQAEAWRSETSMLQLKSSYQALQKYFLQGVKPLLLAEKKVYLANSIEDTFKELLTGWPVDPSLKKLLSDKTGLKQLYRSKMSMDKLSYQLQDELPLALNIIVGFNATDGD